MGYRIRYAQEMIKETIPNKDSRKRSYAFLWCLIGICTLIYTIYAHREAALSIICPGDREVTIEALSVFSNSLSNGLPFKDAFAEFCYVVICGAG